MASVLNRTTNEYLESVNTPDFPTEDWLYNPDVSAVLNESEQIPTRYWIIPEDAPQEGAVITADRVSWKRNEKVSELDSYFVEVQEEPFHWAKNGQHLSEGDLYDSVRFDNITGQQTMTSISTGVPRIPDTVEWTQYVEEKDEAAPLPTITLTKSEFVNLAARYEDTRESLRQDYFRKLDEIRQLPDEQSIDDYDVTEGWTEV